MTESSEFASHTYRSWAPLGKRAILLTLVFVFASGTAASGEWLVLQDGQLVETKGPWEVKEGRVTFTAMNGTFSALRAALVDLEASAQRSVVKAQPLPPSPAQRAPGLVVRQGDISVLEPKPLISEGSAPAPKGTLGVTEWSEVVVRNGSKLKGVLHNGSDSVYLSLQLEATLVADNGDALDRQTASLEKNWADPGTSLHFEVAFPDVYAYADASFEVKGRPFVKGGADTARTGEAAAPKASPTVLPRREPPPNR